MTKTIDMLVSASKIGARVIGDNTEMMDPARFDTRLPALNTIMSASPAGGLLSGTTVIAGESRSFKTMIGLLCVKAYLDSDEDAVCVFFDSEYGAMPSYMDTIGVDRHRIVHDPVSTIEDLRTELAAMIAKIKENDLKVIFFLDSLGMLTTQAEITNSETGEIKVDMGALAKSIKSMFKNVNVPLNMYKIPFVIINHIYEKMGQMYSQKVMSGGQGPMLAANTVLFVSASMLKKGAEEVGKRFTIRVEKGRFVKPKRKIYLDIEYAGKINKMVGVFDMLVDVGIISSAPGGWWKLPDGSKVQRAKVTDEQLAALLEEHHDEIENFFKYENTF